jgi:hypothetical protein
MTESEQEKELKRAEEFFTTGKGGKSFDFIEFEWVADARTIYKGNKMTEKTEQVEKLIRFGKQQCRRVHAELSILEEQLELVRAEYDTLSEFFDSLQITNKETNND